MSSFARRHGVNVGLIVAALALSTWVAVVEPNLQSSSESQTRARNLFRTFSRTGLTAIELEPAGAAKIVVTRANADAPWVLQVDGATVEGDETALDKLATTLEYATTLREASGGEFGLATPRLRGAIVVNGQRQEFSLGADAPVVAGATGTAYVRVGSEPVRVVGASFVAELLAPASRLYDRRVVPYLSVETKHVEVLRGRERLVAFDRTDDRLWHFADAKDRVSRAASDVFWAAVADLQSEKELGPNAWPAGRDDEVLTVRLVPRDGRPVAGLEMLAGCNGGPGATLRLSGTKARVVCVGAGAFESLARSSVDGFRDAAPIALRADEIQAIRIREDGETFELGRQGAGFVVRSKGNAPVAPELTADVTAWLQDLARPGVRVDEGPSGTLRGTVEVYTDRTDAAETLTIVRRDGDKVTLRRGDDGALVELSGAVGARLSARGGWLRSRNVFEAGLAARAVQRLELACDGRREVVERGPEGWAFAEPKGPAPVDGARVLDVASKLLSTRADRWLEGDEHLGSGVCVGAVTVEGDAGAIRYEVRFGGPREGAFVATATGASASFLAPKAARDLVVTSLLDRALGPGNLDDAFTVVFMRNGVRTVYTRTSRGLRLQGAEANEAIAERVTTRLAGLVADEVIRASAPVESDGFGSPGASIEWSGRDGKALGSLTFGRVITRAGEKLVTVIAPRGGAVLAVRQDALEALFEAVP